MQVEIAGVMVERITVLWAPTGEKQKPAKTARRDICGNPPTVHYQDSNVRREGALSDTVSLTKRPLLMNYSPWLETIVETRKNM